MLITNKGGVSDVRQKKMYKEKQCKKDIWKTNLDVFIEFFYISKRQLVHYKNKTKKTWF
jgi:hypothetical protein